MAELLPHNKGKVPGYWTAQNGESLQHDAVPHALAGNLPAAAVYSTGTVEGEDLANHGLDPDGGVAGPIVEATGATAGIAGTWTPLGSIAAADLAAANTDILPNPNSLWTEGQYIVLGDGSEAYCSAANTFLAGRAPA